MPLFLILFALVLSLPAYAQSFDCDHATKPREHAVCGSPELRQLDTQLAAEYERVHNGVPAASASAILADQRAWLRSSNTDCDVISRGKTTLPDCLAEQYKSRLDELRQELDLGDGHWLIRVHERDGTYPLVQPYSPVQADWNHAAHAVIAAREAKAAGDLKQCQKDGADLPGQMRDNMEVDADWRVAAANTHLITLRFTRFEYCGGVHPNTSFEDWSWSLDTDTLLAVPQVFATSAHWQQPVIATVKDRLRKLDDFEGYSGSNMIDGADTIVKDTKQWQPTREGLRFQFQQYQVAAYVYGMPAITIPWSDLKPYLNRSWQPESLPARLPDPDDR